MNVTGQVLVTTRQSLVEPNLDTVIAENVKHLRRQAGMTQTQLADLLSFWLVEGWSRFKVADLEGRRRHEVRWSEVVALCTVFDVPLWKVVLPRDNNTRIHAPAQGAPRQPIGASADATDVLVEMDEELPGRLELAWLLFSVDDESLGKEVLARVRDTHRREQEAQSQEIVEAVLAQLRKEH